MAVSEPSNTLARPQSVAPASSPCDVRHQAESSPNAAAIAEPSARDYIRVLIFFSAIWAICAGAAFWGVL
jgi:hypothetical protein